MGIEPGPPALDVCFIPVRTANDLQLRKISIPDFIHYLFYCLWYSGQVDFESFHALDKIWIWYYL